MGRDLGARAAALIRLLGRLGRAPSTPFNQPIGPHRRVDWLSFELSTIKAIRNQLGGTINDVVLTTVAGAVGKFLARRRASSSSGEFRTVVPVSVRGADERGVPGNRVSVWLTALPVDEPDARRRLAAVRALTAAAQGRSGRHGRRDRSPRRRSGRPANVIKLAAQFINSTRAAST